MKQSHPTTGAVPDAECPVSLDLLGQVYRADDYDLNELLEAMPALTRAKLAAYLYGKSHTHKLGLRVARTCEREDLILAAGEIGSVIHGQSHLKPVSPAEEPAPAANERKASGRKVSLGGNAPKKISLGGSAAKGRNFDFG